jgi:hypothetical protein
MKATLYKLKEGYVLCNNEDIKDNDIVLVNKKWHDNVLRIFTTVFGGTKEGCKKVLSQSPDFSLLSEEDVKRIGWFDVEKVIKEHMGLLQMVVVPVEPVVHFESLKEIFQKALELTADRRFTEDDIKQAYYQGRKDAVNSVTNKLDFINPDDYIKSISQPKSWEVEYKEENGVYKVLKIN